ncbi:MAG: NF038122 family metalloprotease [Elainellaceae cyanobacterium]
MVTVLNNPPKLLPIKIVSALTFILIADNSIGLRIAQAVSFNIQSNGATSQQALDAFTTASQPWSSRLQDDVVINLNIGFERLNSSVLGTTLPVEVKYSYDAVLDALSRDVTSSNDAIATSSLQSTSAFDLLINYTSDNPNGYGSSTAYLDNDGSKNNRQIRITSANAKSLGLQSNTGQDGSITFNSDINWDFIPEDGIATGAFDFISVATHEIGHALGFISGVDLLDQYSPFQVNRNEFYFPEDTFAGVSTLDLFRFSDESVAYGDGVIDWTAGSNPKYFSIDGGQTPLGNFSTGTFNGDGKATSHWKNGQNLGIMDPDIRTGESLSISSLDLLAFDVIGWDVERSSSRSHVNGQFLGSSNLTLPSSPVNLDVAESVPEPGFGKGILLFGVLGLSKLIRRCQLNAASSVG